MTIINLKKEAGLKVIQFEGQEFEATGSDTLPAWTIELGDYDGTGATVNHPFRAIPMTQKQYDDIVEFKGEATTRVAGEPYTPPVAEKLTTTDILHGETPLNEIVADVIATRNDGADTATKVETLEAVSLETVDRLNKLEAGTTPTEGTETDSESGDGTETASDSGVAVRLQAPKAIMESWTLKNGFLNGVHGDRDRGACRINLNDEFDICQEPFDPDLDEDNGERLMIVSTGRNTYHFHTYSSGDMGTIIDGVSLGIAKTSTPKAV